jgi:hypothetical protein
MNRERAGTQETAMAGCDPHSIEEFVKLREQIPEMLSHRPDLDYELTLGNDGLLQVKYDGSHPPRPGTSGNPTNIEEYIGYVNTLVQPTVSACLNEPIQPLGEWKKTQRLGTMHHPVTRPNPQELRHLLVDTPDAALHISVVQKMIQIMKDDGLDEKNRQRAAIYALKAGSTIARFYEMPQLITEVEDAAFKILWPEEHERAQQMRRQQLGVTEEPTDEWLQVVSDQLKKDFLDATGIPPGDLIFSLRLKGLLSFYSKHLEERSSADTLAYTASVSDKRLGFRIMSKQDTGLPEILENDDLLIKELLNISTTLRSFLQVRYYNMASSLQSIMDGLDIKFGVDGYKAYHLDLFTILPNREHFIAEARITSWKQQAENMLQHVGYKGIWPETEDRNTQDSSLPGRIARANLVNSLNLMSIR